MRGVGRDNGALPAMNTAPHTSQDSFASASALDRAVVAATVARIEQGGALEDSAELRQAFAAAPGRPLQVQQRAWLLGERLGVVTELVRWRRATRLSAFLLALLLALAGLLAGRAVLGEGRSINAIAAFASLLGLHLLTLVLWFFGLLWGLKGGSSHGDWSLGRWALAWAARLPPDRGQHAPEIWQAFAALVQRQRLWPWLAGLLSHTIWAASLTLTLLVLLAGFAFQAYALHWETTILGPAFFQRFVEWTGALPALLGFAVPDADAVRAVAANHAADAAQQRAWAWWLIGCVLAYGLLPRALLALLSLARWRSGLVRLAAVDMADPQIQRVVRRLDALEPPPVVVDAEQRGAALGERAERGPSGATAGVALIGFELPPEMAWPPMGLAGAGWVWSMNLSGSAEERDALRSRLTQQPPGAALVVVFAPGSPDRGTARWLRELRQSVPDLALLASGNDGVTRWHSWMKLEGFEAFTLMEHAQQAIEWIAKRKQR